MDGLVVVRMTEYIVERESHYVPISPPNIREIKPSLLTGHLANVFVNRHVPWETIGMMSPCLQVTFSSPEKESKNPKGHLLHFYSSTSQSLPISPPNNSFGSRMVEVNGLAVGRMSRVHGRERESPCFCRYPSSEKRNRICQGPSSYCLRG